MKHLLLSVFAMAFAFAAAGQCSVSTGDDVFAYFGYDPDTCVSVTAQADTGVAPFTFAWSQGDTTAQVVLCPGVYTVTMTDSTGCTSVDTVSVSVVDVRCGSKLDKVLVCHVPPGNPANAHTICVSANAVQAHLNHGDHLGSCAAPDTTQDTMACEDFDVTILGGDTVVAADSLVCVPLTAVVDSGDAPFVYAWSTGDSTASILACDSQTSTYSVTVSDAAGCVDSATVEVVFEVPDTSTPGGKIIICHIPPGNPANAHTITIHSNALAAHLAHGDSIGGCHGKRRRAVAASPNPFFSVTSILFEAAEDGQVAMEIVGLEGRQFPRTISVTDVQAGGTYRIWLRADQLPGAGLYFYRLVSQSGVLLSGRVLMLD